MADDMRDALQFWGSFLQQKHQNFGGLRAKNTLFENAFMAVNAFLEVDQRNRAEVHHPDNVVFGPLLAEDMNSAAQRIMETCQLMGPDAFAGLCQRFIDYSATLNEPGQRKKAMSLFGVMIASRSQSQSGFSYVQPHQAPPPPAPPAPRPAIAPPAPPHPNEQLFKPYMALGPKAGGEKIAQDFERMSRRAATDFFTAFVKYAVTLRTSDELKTAFALSNKMYVIYVTQQANERLALAAPSRQETRP